ncbi:MAG: RNase adapter RapZ [Neisseria sp.]|nr:RNase adapter RapZ [Neisseria sp.]
MMLTLISGLSGSGKSIALRSLEDLGFFCVDNLPPELLLELTAWHRQQKTGARLAVSIDSRSQVGFEGFPALLQQLRLNGVNTKVLFLESRDEILLKRFSETRRSHPLASGSETLSEAMLAERDMLYPLKDNAFVIDTSDLSAPDLRRRIHEWLGILSDSFVLTFESFGFKYGVPLDVDYIFDVRCLPNPYYDPSLRDQTGYDAAVCDFFAAAPEVAAMSDDIAAFLQRWLPCAANNMRSYLTVGIGCTGGMHRSVYIAKTLAERFQAAYPVLLRHRQLPHLSQRW